MSSLLVLSLMLLCSISSLRTCEAFGGVNPHLLHGQRLSVSHSHCRQKRRILHHQHSGLGFRPDGLHFPRDRIAPASFVALYISASGSKTSSSSPSEGANATSPPTDDEQFGSTAAAKSKVSEELDSIASNGATGASEQTSFPENGFGSAAPTKFRRLKDLMWIRETLEDLTAAEFARTVESGAVAPERKRKRAVDYDKLVSRLDVRVRDMCGPDVDLEGVQDDDVVGALQEGRGMGRIVYTQDQRAALLKRLFETRKVLSSIAGGLNVKDVSKSQNGVDSQVPIDLSEIPELKASKRNGTVSIANVGPKLYVRDDGTVDWDGALQDRAALKEFGTAVWARINGQIPSDEEEGADENDTKSSPADQSKKTAQVTAKIEDTPAIIEAREKLNELKEKYQSMQDSHMALLNSGISAGQAVANVKLASLNPDLRNSIRESAEELDLMEQNVSFQTLIYELERIYTYLATEVANPATAGYVPLQDRLNIAEFGLLESQLDGFSRELNARGSFDADVLAVVMEQLVDFKRRLGIDYYVTGLTYDREAIQRWVNDLWRQTKSGLAFYVKGCRLFWNDIVFCASLIGRAAQGYTLKPREVRTIRRTFKDIITFIPVVVILIIPLSPVGHVLVFGAIQRFFPNFFPSCFTEQRQNLLQLYETTEYSEFTINENWQEKIVRIFKASIFFVVSKSRATFVSLTKGDKKRVNGDDTDSQEPLK